MDDRLLTQWKGWPFLHVIEWVATCPIHGKCSHLFTWGICSKKGWFLFFQTQHLGRCLFFCLFLDERIFERFSLGGTIFSDDVVFPPNSKLAHCFRPNEKKQHIVVSSGKNIRLKTFVSRKTKHPKKCFARKLFCPKKCFVQKTTLKLSGNVVRPE